MEQLKLLCELERNQKLIILQLAPLNAKLAGYMLTGNRSTFLEIKQNVGWLYQCVEKQSLLLQMDKCYDKIPISYRNEIYFVDPVSRRTHDYAREIECTMGPENIFQRDPDDPETWQAMRCFP